MSNLLTDQGEFAVEAFKDVVRQWRFRIDNSGQQMTVNTEDIRTLIDAVELTAGVLQRVLDGDRKIKEMQNRIETILGGSDSVSLKDYPKSH